MLLDLLDRIDGDPDLEDNGDLEPYLANQPERPGVATDAEGDSSDDEPCLGSLDGQMDQQAWNAGSADDYELDETELGFPQIPDHSPAIQLNLGLSSLVSEVSP